MKAMLLVVGGPYEGLKYEIPDGTTQFGREDGKITFPNDGYMSGKHFTITRLGNEIHVKNFSATNPTKLISGSEIVVMAEFEIQHGTHFRAGKSVFCLETDLGTVPPGRGVDPQRTPSAQSAADYSNVPAKTSRPGDRTRSPLAQTGSIQFEEDPSSLYVRPDPDAAPPSVPVASPPSSSESTKSNPFSSTKSVDFPTDDSSSSAATEQSAAAVKKPTDTADTADEDTPIKPILSVTSLPPAVMQYETEPCESILKSYRSPFSPEETGFVPSEFVSFFAGHLEFVWVCHFQKFGKEFPEDLNDVAVPLFDWFPEESARFCPVLIRHQDALSELALLDEAWDFDSTLVFFGKETGAIVDHLQQLLHAKVEKFNEDGGVFYYCWPSVLSQYLTTQPQTVVDTIWGDCMSGVLMEIQDMPNSWRFFGDSDLELLLGNLGFREMHSV